MQNDEVTTKMVRRHAVPIPVGNSYSIRTMRIYSDLSELQQQILNCFDEGADVLYGDVIVKELMPPFKRTTIYDNLNRLTDREVLFCTKDGRMNVYSLTELGRAIIRTKSAGTRLTDIVRLESLRYAYFLEGDRPDLLRLQSDVRHNHLGHCRENDSLNWLQQTVRARFGNIVGFTLQFNWGTVPKVIINVPSIWGESVEDCLNKFFTQLEWLRRRLDAEFARWEVSLSAYAHQINPFEVEVQVDVDNFDVEPHTRFRVARRVVEEDVTADGQRLLSPRTKEEWLDRSKRRLEAGVTVTNAHDLDRALVLTRTPEYIVDLRLRMQEMEEEKDEILNTNESLRDQNNDLTRLVLDQDRRIRTLSDQIEKLTSLVESALNDSVAREGDKRDNLLDFDPFT